MVKREVKHIRQCPDCGRDILYIRDGGYIKAEKNKSKCKKCAGKGIKKTKIGIDVSHIGRHNCMGEKNFVRNCPKCGKEINYVSAYNYRKAVLKKTKCNICAQIRTIKPIGGWKRTCPECGKELQYCGKRALNRANENNSKCQECLTKIEIPVGGWKRNCPKCGKEICYSSKSKSNYTRACNENTKCRKCSNLGIKRPNLSGELNPNYKKLPDGVIKDGNKFKRICPSCKKTLIYNRRSECLNAHNKNGSCISCAKKAKEFHHSEETKNKMSETKLGRTWEMIWGVDGAKNMREYYKTNLSGYNSATVRGQCRKLGITVDEYKDQLTDFQMYKSAVYMFTKRQDVSSLNNYEKRGLAGIQDAYQLDHKVSIRYGFDNNILPSIIGGISNLEFIKWEDNLRKHTQNSMEEEQLFEKVEELSTWPT